MTDRDDDDTPNMRDDRAVHPIAAAATAAKRIGADFYRAFRDANSGDPTREARGMVEMLVLNIRDGEFPGRDFAQPALHFPDDENGLRRLAISKVPADADLKHEVLEWARGNRDKREKAARSLATAVGAYRKADAILADEACTDEELGEWCTEVVNHIMRVWKVNIRMAPTTAPEIEAWCAEAVGRLDVTPRFLTGEERAGNVFDPDEHRERRSGAGAKNPMAFNPLRPFQAHHGDDD